MLKLVFLILMTVMSLPVAYSQDNGKDKIRTMNFDQLEPLLHRQNDTVYLVNFWATWCAPCRKEMPAIQSVAAKYADQPFRTLLVSLDIPGQIEKSLLPYIEAGNITQEVILLDDPDQNRWIDLVDPSWSGELPFTLIYGNDFREGHSEVFTFEILDSIIHSKIKRP
ncbi:MAG TPA: TlpA family protein disulfide reductase [Bacteroidales bacterium]|nr:TlpA family protein disulfide reductase [Bacteroidales bacterium]